MRSPVKRRPVPAGSCLGRGGSTLLVKAPSAAGQASPWVQVQTFHQVTGRSGVQAATGHGAGS